MNRTSLILFLFIISVTAVQCTSTRWTVAETHAIDEREVPERIRSEYRILVSDSVSVSNPVLNLNLYRIDEHEYTQRILVERTVQAYEPKWSFALLGSLGASIAFYAGNTDGFIENTSGKQSLALNTTGAMLALMAFTNMKTVGDAIHTGEMRYLRSSGSVIKSDTVRVAQSGSQEIEADLHISYREETLLERSFEEFGHEEFSVQLTSLVNNRTISGDDPGEFEVTLSQHDEVSRFHIPVTSFMRPVVTVTSPLAELRTSPVYDDSAPFAEVGSGSEFILLEERGENWFEVQMGGSNLFITRDDGEIHWKEEENIPTVITLDEVPFGELSVEFAVPVLRTASPSGLGLLVGNHSGNQLGSRRYIERDFRLMDLYLENSLGIPQHRIHNRDITDSASYSGMMEDIRTDSSSAVYVYISGFARINSDGSHDTIDLVHLDEENDVNYVNLENMLIDIAGYSSGRMIAFIDLEFRHSLEDEGTPPSNNGRSVYQGIANAVSGVNQDSALIFSSRADQSPGLFESVRFEIKYHHIFPYFIAQAIQQRRTNLSDLVRYIENQIDYTSRRLHDRPQNVQAYGNLSLDLAD